MLGKLILFFALFAPLSECVEGENFHHGYFRPASDNRSNFYAKQEIPSKLKFLEHFHRRHRLSEIPKKTAKPAKSSAFAASSPRKNKTFRSPPKYNYGPVQTWSQPSPWRHETYAPQTWSTPWGYNSFAPQTLFIAPRIPSSNQQYGYSVPRAATNNKPYPIQPKKPKAPLKPKNKSAPKISWVSSQVKQKTFSSFNKYNQRPATKKVSQKLKSQVIKPNNRLTDKNRISTKSLAEPKKSKPTFYIPYTHAIRNHPPANDPKYPRNTPHPPKSRQSFPSPEKPVSNEQLTELLANTFLIDKQKVAQILNTILQVNNSTTADKQRVLQALRGQAQLIFDHTHKLQNLTSNALNVRHLSVPGRRQMFNYLERKKGSLPDHKTTISRIQQKFYSRPPPLHFRGMMPYISDVNQPSRNPESANVHMSNPPPLLPKDNHVIRPINATFVNRQRHIGRKAKHINANLQSFLDNFIHSLNKSIHSCENCLKKSQLLQKNKVTTKQQPAVTKTLQNKEVPLRPLKLTPKKSSLTVLPSKREMRVPINRQLRYPIINPINPVRQSQRNLLYVNKYFNKGNLPTPRKQPFIANTALSLFSFYPKSSLKPVLLFPKISRSAEDLPPHQKATQRFVLRKTKRQQEIPRVESPTEIKSTIENNKLVSRPVPKNMIFISKQGKGNKPRVQSATEIKSTIENKKLVSRPVPKGIIFIAEENERNKEIPKFQSATKIKSNIGNNKMVSEPVLKNVLFIRKEKFGERKREIPRVESTTKMESNIENSKFVNGPVPKDMILIEKEKPGNRFSVVHCLYYPCELDKQSDLLTMNIRQPQNPVVNRQADTRTIEGFKAAMLDKTRLEGDVYYEPRMNDNPELWSYLGSVGNDGVQGTRGILRNNLPNQGFKRMTFYDQNLKKLNGFLNVKNLLNPAKPNVVLREGSTSKIGSVNINKGPQFDSSTKPHVDISHAPIDSPLRKPFPGKFIYNSSTLLKDLILGQDHNLSDNDEFGITDEDLRSIKRDHMTGDTPEFSTHDVKMQAQLTSQIKPRDTAPNKFTDLSNSTSERLIQNEKQPFLVSKRLYSGEKKPTEKDQAPAKRQHTPIAGSWKNYLQDFRSQVRSQTRSKDEVDQISLMSEREDSEGDEVRYKMDKPVLVSLDDSTVTISDTGPPLIFASTHETSGVLKRNASHLAYDAKNVSDNNSFANKILDNSNDAKNVSNNNNVKNVSSNKTLVINDSDNISNDTAKWISDNNDSANNISFLLPQNTSNEIRAIDSSVAPIFPSNNTPYMNDNVPGDSSVSFGQEEIAGSRSFEGNTHQHNEKYVLDMENDDIDDTEDDETPINTDSTIRSNEKTPMVKSATNLQQVPSTDSEQLPQNTIPHTSNFSSNATADDNADSYDEDEPTDDEVADDDVRQNSATPQKDLMQENETTAESVLVEKAGEPETVDENADENAPIAVGEIDNDKDHLDQDNGNENQQASRPIDEDNEFQAEIVE